jgi:hypothetical protein
MLSHLQLAVGELRWKYTFIEARHHTELIMNFQLYLFPSTASVV